jgi:class 3 adenylate cyclase
MLFEDTDESATEAAELFSFGAPPPPPAGPPPAAAAPAPAPAPAPAELPEVAPPAPTSGAGDFFGSAWGAGAWAGVKGVRQAVQGTLMQTLGEPSHSTSKGDDSHQPNHHQQQQIQHEVLEDEKEVELRLMVQPLTVPGTPVSEKLIALRRLTELLEGPSRPPLRYLGFLCEPLVEALTDAGLLDKFYAQSVMAALTSALSTEDINELGVEFVNLGVVEGLLTLLSPKYELTRIGIVALLIRLVRHKDTRSDVQLRVQRYPAGMQAIVDMLDDGWEEIRNACLSLLSSLLRMDEDRDDECPSSDLQSFIAFAEGYEKLFSIAGQERESALSVRCLTVVRATLVGNPMTEKLFVSGGHVSVLVSFVTFSGHDLLGGSAAGFVEDVSLDGSVSQETTDSVSEGGLGGLQLSILRQEQALAAVRILRCIGQSESRATVTHTPGLMPALCELAFSTFDESANQHQGRSWSAYGLREAVCSEARRALASLLRDCAKAQVAFSLSCVEGVPEVTPVEGRPDGKPGVFFSADGQPYRISPSMSEPKIALEALVAGILHGPVDGKIADEAVAIFDVRPLAVSWTAHGAPLALLVYALPHSPFSRISGFYTGQWSMVPAISHESETAACYGS